MTEEEYGQAMLALTRSEGHMPRRGPWPGVKSANETPLEPWLVEVLRRSGDGNGFLLSVENCKDAGSSGHRISQAVSPLLTRGLVRSKADPSRRRRFFITPTGRKYLSAIGQ